jgi:hypothetical protein
VIMWWPDRRHDAHELHPRVCHSSLM